MDLLFAILLMNSGKPMPIFVAHSRSLTAFDSLLYAFFLERVTLCGYIPVLRAIL